MAKKTYDATASTVKEPWQQPFVCPVCGGHGCMPAGFYDCLAYASTDATPEMCRSCSGTGVVWRTHMTNCPECKSNNQINKKDDWEMV